SASSCVEPRCSIERDPRRDDHTICTAVAPELVLTVRTYARPHPTGPRLVHKSAPTASRTCSSQPYSIAGPTTVIKVGLYCPAAEPGTRGSCSRSAERARPVKGHDLR